MRKLSLLSLVMVAMLFITSCQKENDEALKPQQQSSEALLNKEGIALQVVDLMNESSSRKAIMSSLQDNKIGVKLETVVDKIEATGMRSSATSGLRSAIQEAKEKNRQHAGESAEVPELWLYTPEGSYNPQDILVSFPPEGDESEWERVKAYTLDKKVVYLDPHQEPNVPVVVVETHGFEALKVEVDYINEVLQNAGLQKQLSKKVDPNTSNRAADGLETTILDNIRLNNDQEPWISGASEIYAVTTGIRSTANEPEVAVIPMYYLDNDGKVYYPNQIMLFWNVYAYQAANMQLFEKDDNHNYKELASTLVNGILNITGTLTGKPWLSALGEIASAVIKAMPDSFWTNDDDYVDSFYTLEKNKVYTNYYGAAGNARVSMRPYFVPAN